MNKKSKDFIINQHNNAIFNIKQLENTCANFKITDDKTKTKFGNFCVALSGYRMIADATEAILINENILKGDDGNFYEKVDTSDKGSDFDNNNSQNHE